MARPLRLTASVILGLLLAALLAYIVPVNDFVQYWSGSRLLLIGGNPYSAAQILRLEQSAGWPKPVPIPTYNPPWTLALFLLYGALPYRIGETLWFFFNVVALVSCSKLLSSAYSRGESDLALHVTFVPVLICVLSGQISLLMLLGAVLFLRAVQRGDDYRAGAEAALLAVKPQVLYLFWAALIIWTVTQRRWRVLIGLAVTLLLCSAVVTALNPSIFLLYLRQYRESHVLVSPSHTIGTLLRAAFGWDRQWLQFLPSAAGLVWLALRWRRWNVLDWPRRLPLLAMISITTSSYAWIYDHVLLLPALAMLMPRLPGLPPRLRFAIVTAYTGANLSIAVLTLMKAPPLVFCCVSLVWLGLYLLTDATRKRISSCQT